MSKSGAAGKQRGFTVFEALIVIAIMAVLLGVAAPNLRTFVSDARVSGAATDLISDIYVARSAATKLQCDVQIISEPTGSASWAGGWKVSYMAEDPAGGDLGCAATGGDEVVLKRRDPHGGDVVIAGPEGAVVFGYDGRQVGAERNWEIQAPNANDKVHMRCVEISPAGKPREQKDVDYNNGNGC